VKELKKYPDVELVEVVDGQQHIQIGTRHGKLQIDVEAPDQNVHLLFAAFDAGGCHEAVGSQRPRGLTFWTKQVLLKELPNLLVRTARFARLKIKALRTWRLSSSRRAADAASVFHHVRMAAEISGCGFRPQTPRIGILAQ